MTKYNKHNAPKGWMFPFNKKDINFIINETGAVFESVDFNNTEKPSEYIKGTIVCWCGVLTSNRTDGEYRFSLKLSSFKEEYVKPWKTNIINLVGSEITNWVKCKLSQPENSTEKPTQLFLRYEIKNGLILSSCHEVD